MIWQDWVFTIGSWVFIVALIPTMRSKNKPPFSTSMPTSVVLLFFAGSFLTLNLWGSAFSALINSVCWGFIAFSKTREN